MDRNIDWEIHYVQLKVKEICFEIRNSVIFVTKFFWLCARDYIN